MTGSAIAHVTLATRDVRKSAEFFTTTLRWEPINRPGNIGTPAAWLRIGPEQELQLIEVPEFEPSSFEREFGRHFAMTYSLSEFPQLKDRLVANGAQLIEPERKTPFQRFFFRDPNGYVFEIVEADHKPEA